MTNFQRLAEVQGVYVIVNLNLRHEGIEISTLPMGTTYYAAKVGSKKAYFELVKNASSCHIECWHSSQGKYGKNFFSYNLTGLVSFVERKHIEHGQKISKAFAILQSVKN